MSDVTLVEAIYLDALQKAVPAERAAYLDAACGSDTALRDQVEQLLAAHSSAGQFLEADPLPTSEYVKDTESKQPISSAIIANRYKLLERIGEGGMGEVWVAEQTEPVKRKVAVKLIKAGMDSRAVLARFEAERQALAVMDHPNIAKVLDGGLHDGRPYFVMELVKGTPITEYCDRHCLTLLERLQLFVPVCHAIQHAHQKGVIHRDIKPSNVMVALYDDRPIPKVIDFGVAKATGQTLTEMTLHTGFGSVVGTPEYMSPEQASFNNLDIDTRSDVYSLGVLLYELLTGTTPVDRKSLGEAAVLEVLRIVREVEAPRPSLKLSTTDALPSIAASRGTEPTKLPSMMRGELDWIVLKALEKDRGRRYDSANGLAADVSRYLSGEAVAACPPTLGYRLRKAYRRNRAAVLVGLTIAALLSVSAVGATVLAVKARRAEQLAEVKRMEAEEQKAKVELYSADYRVLSETYKAAVEESEVRNVSARLDADLSTYKADARIGLLLLARPLNDMAGPLGVDLPSGKKTLTWSFPHHPELRKLREFQAAAVIIAGQQFVPLVAPIEGSTGSNSQSPDGRRIILATEQTGLQLLELPNQISLGVLREANERLTAWGFSPDSQTVWTQDTDSVLRFWNTDGTFRAKTPLRADRFVYPAGLQVDNLRASIANQSPNEVFVTDGVAVYQTKYRDWEWVSDHAGQPMWIKPKKGTVESEGTAELYSTRTGQLIRRIDQIDPRSFWRLYAQDRWLIYVDYSRSEPQVVVLSSADGQELARLDHRLTRGDGRVDVTVSPTGKWVLSAEHVDSSATERAPFLERYRLWSSSTWQRADERILQDIGERVFSFVSDNILAFDHRDHPRGIELMKIGEKSHIYDQSLQLDYHDHEGYECLSAVFDETLIYDGYCKTMLDAKTFQPLNPPPGRRYTPELARLAPDGRFFEGLDTVTEKDLPEDTYGIHHPGLGVVSVEVFASDLYNLHILPDPSKLNIPPAMLELWAQVVVGGELGTDDQFTAWDEPTWQAKQKELAAMAPPYKDFPFPGFVATEPHLWWHIQGYSQLMKSPFWKSDEYDEKFHKEFMNLNREWRRRSGRLRLEPEPDSWRTPGPVDSPVSESRTDS